MTDQTPETAPEPDARRGAVRARRRLVRTGTIVAVMALGAGGGVAAAAGAGDLLAPAGSLTSATHAVSDPNGAVRALHDQLGHLGQLGQLQGLVGGGPQAVQMRGNGDPAGDLTGTVTDQGGNPLSDIDLYEVTGNDMKLLGRTGDDGTFKVDCPAGPVLLSSTGLTNGVNDTSPAALGKLAYQFLDSVKGGVQQLTNAPVPNCDDAHPYRAEMAPGGQVSGVLRDSAGKALAHTPITLADEADPKGLQLRTVTDKRGRFMFSGLPAGRYQTLAGSAPIGGPSDVTANAPVVHDLVDTVSNTTSGATGGAVDGSAGDTSGSASMMRGVAGDAVPGVAGGLVSSAGNLPTSNLPLGGVTAGLPLH